LNAGPLGCSQVTLQKLLKDEHIRALEAEFAVAESGGGGPSNSGASGSTQQQQTTILPMKRIQNLNIILKSWKMTAQQVWWWWWLCVWVCGGAGDH
jgi:hypothetical protein